MTKTICNSKLNKRGTFLFDTRLLKVRVWWKIVLNKLSFNYLYFDTRLLKVRVWWKIVLNKLSFNYLYKDEIINKATIFLTQKND